MKAEDFLSAPSAEDFLTGADGSGEMTIPIKRRRGTEKARYVAPDNPDNPIAPAPGLVAESIRMPAPTFDEERKGRAAVDGLIAKTPAPAPRGPRPQRDIKGVAQDLYSILGNTGVQLVKPFVDVPNMFTGGALDGASRFLNNAGQAANLAASPATNYDRETLGLMPEGASLDKVDQLLTNPGLAANMGIPSAASMVMPLAATKAMGVLFPKAAAAMGEGFQTGAAVRSNALMNAGDTFGQTQADTDGRLLAALGSGVSSALVGKATGGGLEGQLARGKIPTWGAARKGIGNDSLQEGGENFGNQLAQDTGEGKPLNFGAALDQAAIGATLAPFVSGPINIAGVATSPERANARLLSDAINGFDPSVLFPNAPDPIVRPSGPRFDPVAAAAANMQPPSPAPAPIPQLGYDPTVQNQIPAVAVESQGNARPMSAEEFLTADNQRQEQQDMGLTPDVQKAIADRNVSPAAETAPDVPSDLVKRPIDSGWTPPEKQAPASEGNNPNPDPATVNGIGGDLEKLYQQDVKDGIKQRLGLEQPPVKQPAPEAKPASYAQSPFLREIAARGGVNMGERSDTGVDPNRLTAKGKVMPAPYNIAGKPLFRPDGLRGDQLVESLVSQGYLTPAQVEEADAGGVGGSDQLAYDLIRKELESPGSVKPINMQGDTAQQAMQQRASSELDSKARSIGLDTKGLNDDQINLALKRIERRLARSKGRADVSREVKAEREAMDDVAPAPDYNYDDSDIPWGDEQSNASEADAMRALGFTDQEIQDAALADRSSPAQARPEDAPQAAPNDTAGPPGPAPADARGEGGQRPDAQPEGLTSYTPEELRQRDQRIADQTRAEARQQAETEAKATADSERGEFALTGSDRPADVAAAGGQEGLFSQDQTAAPARAPKSPEVASLVELRKRESILKSLRKCLA